MAVLMPNESRCCRLIWPLQRAAVGARGGRRARPSPRDDVLGTSPGQTPSPQPIGRLFTPPSGGACGKTGGLPGSTTPPIDAHAKASYMVYIVCPSILI